MTVGDTSPRGYLRGSPLDTPFVSFLVKGKIPRCGARSSTKERFAESSVRSKVPNLSFLPHNKTTSSFWFCGLMPPTPAHSFFLRRKDAKTYPRGSVLLDISSGGSIPRSNRKRSRAPIYHKTTVVLLGKSRGAGQCFSFTGKQTLQSLPLRISTSSILR